MSRLSRVWSVAVVAALFGPATVAARDLRISHEWPAEDARHRAAEVFVMELMARAPDLKVTIHPNSGLKIKPIDQYKALLDGKAEMAIFPPHYNLKDVPEFAISGLPGVPSNAALGSQLRGTEFENLLRRVCEQKGLHIVTWWWLGGGIVSRTKPIARPDDLKGLSVRGVASFGTLLTAAGANSIQANNSEARAAMEAGKLDAIVNTYESLLSFRMQELTKFASFGGTGIITTFVPIIMAKPVWDSLTDDEKLAVDTAANLADDYFQTTQKEIEQATIAAFMKAGVTVKPIESEDYVAWLKLAKESAWKDYTSKSRDADRLFTALLRSFITNVR